MKILAVNLLRLGDIIMTSGVLKALKEKNPRCELHLLVNQQFASVARLMPFIDKFIYFDRARAQKGLGEFENPLCDSYDYLKTLVETLNGNHYQKAFNFSQNLFSARLMGLINCPEKIGMTLELGSNAAFGSPWLEKLNRRNRGEPVHYIDYMARACGIANIIPRPHLHVARQEDLNPNRPYVVVQALTNDTKKNWGISAYAMMVRFIERHRKDLSFIFLSAPNEENILAADIQSLRASGVRADLRVCDLSEAFNLIFSAELLVTGDTSIKHLGSAADTPILELSLGSSDFHFTGAYSNNAYILQGNVTCAPCGHSGNCPLARRVCADAINPHVVAHIARAIMDGTSLNYFEDLYKGAFLPNGMWSAQPVSYAEDFDMSKETVRGVASEL